MWDQILSLISTNEHYSKMHCLRMHQQL